MTNSIEYLNFPNTLELNDLLWWVLAHSLWTIAVTSNLICMLKRIWKEQDNRTARRHFGPSPTKKRKRKKWGEWLEAAWCSKHNDRMFYAVNHLNSLAIDLSKTRSISHSTISDFLVNLGLQKKKKKKKRSASCLHQEITASERGGFFCAPKAGAGCCRPGMRTAAVSWVGSLALGVSWVPQPRFHFLLNR